MYSAGLLALALAAQGQLVNDWTNPASARWESSSWSLGGLPASNQTVNITKILKSWLPVKLSRASPLRSQRRGYPTPCS